MPGEKKGRYRVMINVAIAGFGWWGAYLARRLAGSKALTVRAIVEPDRGRTEAIVASGYEHLTDFRQALDNPALDAVLIATPSRLHADQIEAAAAAGKHVFCEKPLSMNAADARRAVDACKDANIVLGVGHMRRFEPAMQYLKQQVAEGTLGTIMHAEAAFSHDKIAGVEPGNWRTTSAESPAAGMTATGIHLSDVLISLFGRVETVQALTASRLLGWETGEVLTVQLGFEAGMTATFSAVLATPPFIRFQVFGSRKWIEVRNPDHPDVPDIQAEVTEMETGREASKSRFPWTDSVVANLEAFAAAVSGEAEYPIRTDDMVHNIEVLEAVIKAADKRETVRISA